MIVKDPVGVHINFPGSEPSSDYRTPTKKQIKEEIGEAYTELWEIRDELVEMNTEDEGYYLDVEEIDFGMYPTLFDYLIYSWTGFLFSGKSIKQEELELIVRDEFERDVNLEDSPFLLSAELMEQASKLYINGRAEACERWRIKRLIDKGCRRKT